MEIDKKKKKKKKKLTMLNETNREKHETYNNKTLK